MVEPKPDITGIACGRTVVYPSVADDGGQCWFRGTSQAAPHVAGLAALIRQRFPDYGPRETVSYLQQHASDRGTAGAEQYLGARFGNLACSRGCANLSHRQYRRRRRRQTLARSSYPGMPYRKATYYRVGYVNMVTDHPLAEASVTRRMA